MPHLESKTKLIMTASVNWYINPFFKIVCKSSEKYMKTQTKTMLLSRKI